MRTLLECIKFNWRVLSFRATEEDFANAKWPQYVYGLFVTWLVGFGRWWDATDPRIDPILRTGIASVAYSFFMCLLIYFFMKWMLPLKNYANEKVFPQTWLFVTHTSLPGLLYAIPVEKFLPYENATAMNSLFLAAVAIWRVSLFAHHLFSVRELTALQTFCAMFLPLSGILTALTLFGMEASTFDFMSGNTRGGQSSAMQTQFEIIGFLAVGSIMGLFLMVPGYLLVAERAHFDRKRERAAGEEKTR